MIVINIKCCWFIWPIQVLYCKKGIYLINIYKNCVDGTYYNI
jgi:hypothetical protein